MDSDVTLKELEKEYNDIKDKGYEGIWKIFEGKEIGVQLFHGARLLYTYGNLFGCEDGGYLLERLSHNKLREEDKKVFEEAWDKLRKYINVTEEKDPLDIFKELYKDISNKWKSIRKNKLYLYIIDDYVLMDVDKKLKDDLSTKIRKDKLLFNTVKTLFYNDNGYLNRDNVMYLLYYRNYNYRDLAVQFLNNKYKEGGGEVDEFKEMLKERMKDIYGDMEYTAKFFSFFGSTLRYFMRFLEEYPFRTEAMIFQLDPFNMYPLLRKNKGAAIERLLKDRETKLILYLYANKIRKWKQELTFDSAIDEIINFSKLLISNNIPPYLARKKIIYKFSDLSKKWEKIKTIIDGYSGGKLINDYDALAQKLQDCEDCEFWKFNLVRTDTETETLPLLNSIINGYVKDKAVKFIKGHNKKSFDKGSYEYIFRQLLKENPVVFQSDEEYEKALNDFFSGERLLSPKEIWGIAKKGLKRLPARGSENIL